MRLKVSASSSGDKVITIDNGSTVGDLLENASPKIIVERIRFGYPPQTLEITPETRLQKLEDVGLSSGEKVSLICESGPNNGTVIEGTPKEPPLRIDQIKVGDKTLQVHKVPDDNSCLFHSISYCMYKDITISSKLRELCSREILGDKSKYNEAILGKRPQDYSNWILRKDSWGGGIEISILSSAMNVGIYVLDMDAVKYEKFNDDKYDQFIVIMFNGVHYDSIEYKENHTTVFDKNDSVSDIMMASALDMATNMKQKGYAFNTQRAQIICHICRETFTGERDIARHAEKTGHTDFGQK